MIECFMKNLFFPITILIFAFAAVSCSKNGIDVTSGVAVDAPLLKVTASIADEEDTKMSYAFSTSSDPTTKIKTKWSVGDKIFGFDNRGQNFTFTVASVVSGTAYLSLGDYEPDNASRLYAVYYPGHSASEFKGRKMPVDISLQGGALDSDSPVILCGSADIENNEASLLFTNQMAVVGLYKFQVGANETVTGVTLNGVETGGVIGMSGNKLSLVSSGENIGSITADGLALKADADGIVKVSSSDMAPYFAVIPTPNPKITLSVTTSDGKEYSNITALPSDPIVSGKYYYIGKKFGEVVADVDGLEFSSIEAAIEAANASEEDAKITLRANVNPSASLEINNVNGRTLTFDFNDHTISSNVTNSVICSTSVVFVDGPQAKGGISSTKLALSIRGGENRILGGNYTGKNTYGVIRIFPDSRTVIDGPVIVTAGDQSRCVNVGYSSSSRGGELIINSGTFVSTDWGTIRTTYGKLTVNGGTFVSGCDSVVYSSVKVSGTSGTIINGGNFYAGTVTEEKIKYVGGPGIEGGVYGGRFNNSPSEDAVAAGFKDVASSATIEGRSYTRNVVEGTGAVASIGSSTYTTFSKAVTAANSLSSPATLKLLGDVSLTEAVNLTNTNGVEITLDLNGRTISANSSSTVMTIGSDFKIVDASGVGKMLNEGTGVLILVNGDGISGTISGGSFYGHAQYGTIRVYGQNSHPARLTVSGNTVISAAGNGHRAINLGYNGTSVRGILEMSSGTLISENAEALKVQWGEAEITGGTFIGATSAVITCINSSGSTTAAPNQFARISGGLFYNASSTEPIITGDGMPGKVSGGYFNHPVDPSYAAEGRLCREVSPVVSAGRKYSYTVGPFIEIVGGGSYASLNSAFEAAGNSTSDCCIRLYGDCAEDTLTLNNTFGKTVTLDLNGCTVTTAMSVGGKVVIRDGSSSKCGKLAIPAAKPEGRAYYGVNIGLLPGCDLTVESGAIEGRLGSPASYDWISVFKSYGTSGNRVKLTISGGDFFTKSQSGIFCGPYADVSVTGGNFAADGSYGRGFRLYAGTHLTVSGGTFMTKSQMVLFSSGSNNPSVEINGGTFASYNQNLISFGAKGAVTINAGSFAVQKDMALFAGTYMDSSTKKICGGRFSADFSSSFPAYSGYEWKSIPEDSSTVPGFTLVSEVKKK